MRPDRIIALGLGMLAVVGCQSSSQRVRAELVLPERAERIEPTSHQRFVFPGELGSLVQPRFPDGFPPGERVDVTVCVSFTVDDGGAVTDVATEILPGHACATQSKHPEFIESAMSALRSWEFVAAALCDYDTPALKEADDERCGNATRVTAVPVRLAWTFRFIADRSGRRVQRAT